MGTIKKLPETVRNTVRSGVVLFDLTRIVEELVFNSLDAGATKVSVFVGVGTCYVKVVDNGSGISRDGLMLLGERYATSKLQRLADMDAASRTFGFRGEALASISDVSLLEILTKAYGRPNGYRKVMKGSKCLYLGIDDDRKEVGTTVVAHDLFYSQPVRRKYMQSSSQLTSSKKKLGLQCSSLTCCACDLEYYIGSPRKVLHAVKKCLLRIALVHPKVSFKVVDIDSEDELLSTHFSSSPLSLLMSGFGIEGSSFLHELSANDGVLRISGYISSPCESFSIKTFIMADINSRFVCKGPIHKLLNQLASSFDPLDSWKVNDGSVKGKKSRSQACPSYILNLSCPQSLYDLSFEPSKTYVVFKDWEPVLAFIDDAIRTVWMKTLACGESFSHTAVKVWKDEMWKKNDNIVSAEGEFFYADLAEDAEFALESSRFQNHQASLHLPSSPLEKLTKENHLFHGDCETITFQEFQIDTTELKEESTEMEFVCQTDCSFQSLDDSFTKCLTTLPWKIDHHSREADISSSSREGYLLDNSFLASGISGIRVEGDFLSSQLVKEYLKTEPHVSNGLSENALCSDKDECSNELEMIMNIGKPSLLSCSSLGSLPFGQAKLGGEEEFVDSFKNKRKRICSDERDDILEVDASTQCFDLYSETLWQDEASYAQDLTKSMRKEDMPTGSDLQSKGFLKSFPYYGESFTEETNFISDSTTLLGNSGSGHKSLNSEWCSIISNPSHQAASWDLGHFSNENAIEGMSRLGEGANYGQLEDTEENCKFRYDVRLKSSNQESCTSICTSSALDFEDNDHSSEYLYKFPQEHNLPNKFFPEHSDMLVDETDWFHSVSSGKDFCKYENQRDWFRYQNCKPYSIPKERSRRSHSAPPFPRQKKRFISLNHFSKMQARESNINSFHHAQTFSEAGVLKHLQQSSGVSHPNLKSRTMEHFEFGIRPDVVKKSDTMMDLKKAQKGEDFKQSHFSQAHHVAHVEEFISKEILDSTDSGTKWRNSCPQTTMENNNNSCDIHNRDDILNISSGLLHLAGDSLVPKSISKNCLEDAKVLQQVDKKFIPVVAGGTLAVIDQHAADERIRLEELRLKVLSGEAKTVTYLDAEQELVLPEIGYQLLHNYTEQMKDWGWICNIHTPGSRSFKKNLSFLHRQATVVTLLAVPCVLGVNLSDLDLLEFLQQLADTDGSSTIPPAVLRVLNSKACRGAIMFGDSLLPSECSLIVEELKQTSLCFQCAHGRPTTVPLVNLEALHKQIARLGVLNDNSSDSWHGLRRHETSLERASQRLRVARG